MSETEQDQLAIARWLDAVNSRGAAEDVKAALTEDAVVERYGFGERKGELAHTFRGHDEISEWLARAPAGTVFRLAGRVEGDNVRYALAVDGFHNGGEWRWRLGGDGRIAWLRHDPDDLPEL